MDWKTKLTSRKFLMACVAGILVILNDGLGWGIPAETVYAFAAIVIGWIASEAHVDGKCACGGTIFIESEEE